MSEQAEQGVMTGVARTQVAGIPIGAVATGAVVAGLVDALMGFIPFAAQPGWQSALMKGAAAWAVIRFGSKPLGDVPAQTAALFLTYDAVQEVFNLRGLFSGIFSGIKLGARSSGNPDSATPVADTVEAYLKQTGG